MNQLSPTQFLILLVPLFQSEYENNKEENCTNKQKPRIRAHLSRSHLLQSAADLITLFLSVFCYSVIGDSL